MIEMPDVLYEVNLLSVTVRVCLAMLLGGILGIERGRKHRPAGLRTYMLVCLGTTIVMLTNQYVYERYGGGDPVRMGAQVISGIGFYEGAVIGGLAAVLILTFFHRVDGFILSKSRHMEVYVEAENIKELSRFLKSVKQQKLEVGNVFPESMEHQKEGGIGAVLVVKWKGKICHEDILNKLQDSPGICHLEEI